MANSEFTQKIMEVLLSWMRLINGWVWNLFQADMGGGFLAWFADNWAHLALFLIILGLVVDWLIWMIRWRPYWLWLRKRQIIYEEVESPGRKKRPQRPQPVRHMPKTQPDNDFDDPFSADEVDPYAAAETAEEEPFDWDSGDDPYAVLQEDAGGREAGKQPRRHLLPNKKKN